MNAEYYLNLVKDWQDPYAAPVIEKHGKVYVVRDDLLEAGTKIRALDYLIKTETDVEEWVFGSSPPWGYGQVSLAYVCRKYGKKAKLFHPHRKIETRHRLQLKAKEFGADIEWIEGKQVRQSKCEKHAREYVQEAPEKRRLFPIGFEHETILGAIVKVGMNLDFEPKEVWTVGSSGVLSRGLQMAWEKAEFNIVQVGRSMKERDIGRAKHFIHPRNFQQKVLPYEAPPFPSVPEYDAKAWYFVQKYGSDGCLFWNVGA